MEKAMAPHSSVLAWRIPGMGQPSRLPPSMGSHRVGHDWRNLAVATAVWDQMSWSSFFECWVFKSASPLSSFTFIKTLFSSSLLSAIRVVSSAYLRLLIFLVMVSHFLEATPLPSICVILGNISLPPILRSPLDSGSTSHYMFCPLAVVGLKMDTSQTHISMRWKTSKKPLFSLGLVVVRVVWASDHQDPLWRSCQRGQQAWRREEEPQDTTQAPGYSWAWCLFSLHFSITGSIS